MSRSCRLHPSCAACPMTWKALYVCSPLESGCVFFRASAVLAGTPGPTLSIGTVSFLQIEAAAGGEDQPAGIRLRGCRRLLVERELGPPRHGDDAHAWRSLWIGRQALHEALKRVGRNSAPAHDERTGEPTALHRPREAAAAEAAGEHRLIDRVRNALRPVGYH